MPFDLLAPTEDPELGLFYLERPGLIANDHRVNLATNRPTAAGMAFLVHPSGLVATASHVPLLCSARPGERVPLFGVSSQVAVEVEAEVLGQGWLGPVTDEGMRLPMSPYWHGAVDERLEVFRQDLAFLRILPETAQWHSRGSRPPANRSPTEALQANARILPLGLVSSRSRGDEVKCWVVVWHKGAPTCHGASGALDGVEPGLFDALRFKSADVGYGFSGSPVWHEQRRVVVGVHRRSVLALPGTRIACDSRAMIRAMPELAVGADRRLVPLLERPLRDSMAGAPQRHPEFLTWHDPRHFVGQEISVAPDIRALPDPSPPVRFPALPHLLSMLTGEPRHQIMLLGAPGTGKSTLLRRLAAALAQRSGQGSAIPIIPVLVSALDLVNAGLNLRRILNEQYLRVRPIEAAAIDVLACAEETCARVVLLVDALDEVAKESSARILGSLLRALRPGSAPSSMEPDLIHHVVIASRHIDETRRPVGPEGGGLHRLNLHPLVAAESRELAFGLVGELTEEQRVRFDASLNDLRLTSAGATPLQVWMASMVFRQDRELPKRPLDLVHSFVAIATSGALNRIKARPGLRISERAEEVYVPAIPEILALVAEVGNQYRDKPLTESLLVDELRVRRAAPNSPSWLVDVNELVAFVLEALPPAIGVLSVVPGADGKTQIDWVHASFKEYFAACQALAGTAPTVQSRSELFQTWLQRTDHWPALTLVSEMERRAQNDLRERDAVEAVLNHCLTAAGTIAKPRLFALRALAVGIDAHGRTRRKQVQMLLRSYVADYTEPSSCESLYRNDDLPDPDEIVARPSLRNDLREALEERFAGRLRLAKQGRTPRILAKEARLIELASLWSEMEDLGLRRPPPSDGQPMQGQAEWDSRSPGLEARDITGLTRLIVQTPTGQFSAVDIPSMFFAENLLRANRLNPDIRSTARLVAIASSWILRKAGEDDADANRLN